MIDLYALLSEPMVGVGVPAAGAAGALAVMGWNREMRRRAVRHRDKLLLVSARNARLPEGAVDIWTPATYKLRGDRSGRIMLVLVGTFAARKGLNVLTLLNRSGLEGAIGSIWLIEADKYRRDEFLASMPAVFSDRLVVTDFPALSAGFGNATPHEVEQLIESWGPDLLRGGDRVCEVHEARQHDEAGLVLMLVSLGGSAITAAWAAESIRRRHRQAGCYGFAAMPVDDRTRNWAPYVIKRCVKAGVRGFVLSDNLGDEVANDHGMEQGIVGFISGALFADAGVESNNAWKLLFERAPGGVVSYHTETRGIPGQRLQPSHPEVPPRYYVFNRNLRISVNSALAEVHRDAHHALQGKGLPGNVSGTSQFVIVLTAVSPSDLKAVEDDIVLGQRLKGIDKRNHHLIFAPLATVVNPTSIRCPVTVVSLQALRNPATLVTDLAKPKRSRGPAEVTTNGHSKMPRRKTSLRKLVGSVRGEK